MRALFARVPHPVAAFGRLVGLLERRLNRPQRSATERRVRGLLLVGFAVVASVGLGTAASLAIRGVAWAWPIEVVVVAVLLAQRSLYDHVRAVALALEQSYEPPERRDRVRHAREQRPHVAGQRGEGQSEQQDHEGFGRRRQQHRRDLGRRVAASQSNGQRPSGAGDRT